MKDTIEVIFGLLGGLAVFLFGMNMMSDCLQKAAGEKMKKDSCTSDQESDSWRYCRCAYHSGFAEQ